ncbi:MAG: hypothetical protein HY784_02175 [Chloroflexi bacterium]|nr:hypothetical protein [Chloroflexota bacterium]
MAPRIVKLLESKREASQRLDPATWEEAARGVGLDPSAGESLAAQVADEAALTRALAAICRPAMPRLYDQIDQMVRLIQSDAWVDDEIARREEHLRIKTMLLRSEIGEEQWGDRAAVPDGVSAAAWREFLDGHQRVRFQHMLSGGNLRKSITNDQNFIAFLNAYRDGARQELGQPHHIDYRPGGPANREVSQKYGKPYDTVFMRMLSWSPSVQGKGLWEIYIPGSTLKGAFRKRASQVLKTLWGDSARTRAVLDRLFGVQGRRGLVFFSDAYLSDPLDPERAWCSMDGVRMDPATARPLETAKADYLFAYGEQLAFTLRLDLQDLAERDLEAVGVLLHLLQDFQRGDIPLGGEKTSGFGWVQAEVTGLTWLTGAANELHRKLFADRSPAPDGLWQKLELAGEAATAALGAGAPLSPAGLKTAPEPPRAAAGFISHRAYGGHSCILAVEAEVLTPLHIAESGEPSFKASPRHQQSGASPRQQQSGAGLSDGPVHGSDFFSMSPPSAQGRPPVDAPQRVYALPSKSLKGMLRHVYAIASDSQQAGRVLGQLNPAEGLFGWVGQGPNQSLMGRVAFSFGLFAGAELAWFKVPYPYGNWQFTGVQWTQTPGGAARKVTVTKNWRLFPHAPLAPVARQLAAFQPDTPQASYFRAILPGARARFSVRFWNLTEDELRRLVWCVGLEDGLAHKMGRYRYLGFGSLALRILPESHLVDWAARYAGKPEGEWQLPLRAEQWRDPGVISHYRDLWQALDARPVLA